MQAILRIWGISSAGCPARTERYVRAGSARKKLRLYYTYVILSVKFERYYVGLTANVEQRVKTHNTGKVKSTKPFIPWKLIHVEEHNTRQEARTREKYLKSAAGRRWRKNNLGH